MSEDSHRWSPLYESNYIGPDEDGICTRAKALTQGKQPLKTRLFDKPAPHGNGPKVNFNLNQASSIGSGKIASSLRHSAGDYTRGVTD
jgi:hypothetical protein